MNRVRSVRNFSVTDHPDYPDLPDGPPQQVAHHFGDGVHEALIMLLEASFGRVMIPELERGYPLFELVEEQIPVAQCIGAKPVDGIDVEAQYWRIIEILLRRQG